MQQKLTLEYDMLIRISLVLAIFADREALKPTEGGASAWMHRPNNSAALNGKRPMELLLSGKIDDLCQIRDHIEIIVSNFRMPPNQVDVDFSAYTDDNIIWS